ncbi:MAG TPA: choice-of-anchor Q domain-containing protein [Prolixibacteraceae bacterium]|nr:choice-of-anchor Q domain-containing protein [Prolixibacteraceae bacterium]
MRIIITVVLVLFAAGLFATNYYIDTDKGNDHHDGTSPQKAWQSLKMVNQAKFLARDSVLFKRGQIFRGTLIPVSGSASGSITYGAYGKGAKPKLLGSVEMNSTADWVNEGGNIWCSSEHKRLTADVGNIIFNNEASCGIKVKEASELKAQGEFWYDKDHGSVKLYSLSNPASFYSDIELALTRNIINENNCSYVTYENLDLRYGAAHGIGGTNTHHIWIKDLNIAWIGGGYLPGYGNGKVRYGNGVEFWNAAHDNMVERCTIDQVYDAALTVQGDETSGYKTFNVYFRNNIINNSEYSYELWGRPAVSHLYDIYFENNTCLNAGFGWGHAQRPDPNGTHVMIWGFLAKSNNVHIRNNIFYQSSDYGARYYEASELTKVTVDYNCWYESTGLVALIGETAFSYATQWDAFREVSKQDIHSIAANPHVNDDCTLRSNSPCIDVGLQTMTVAEDYHHIRRDGEKYDMGAFETISVKK